MKLDDAKTEGSESDIVIGSHSIAACLNNTDRKWHRLVTTEEGIKLFSEKTGVNLKKFPNTIIKIVDGHQLQQLAQNQYNKKGYNFQRIPTQMFLETSPLITDTSQYFESILSNKTTIRIFCLDQVTDIYNGAAILRTAAFYGIDAIVLPFKGSFAFTPSFYRIASGATEYVKIIKTANLSKLIRKVQSLGFLTLGFSEHASDEYIEQVPNRICLVLGSEENGISHAVNRVLDRVVSLKGNGKINSLNVSAASAIIMDRFSKNLS